MPLIKYTAYGNSHIGKVRTENQDDYLLDNENHVFVVADGMGGHPGGRLCAEEMIRFVVSSPFVKTKCDELFLSRHHAEDLAMLMGDAMRLKHCAMRFRIGDEAGRHPGSTLTACKFLGSFVALAHVGDSRLYRLRGKTIEQLSEDHSSNGMLQSAMGGVGIDKFRVQTAAFSAAPGDGFLLCSDGLTSELGDQEILKTWSLAKGNVLFFCNQLISEALRRNGSDNITCVAFCKERGSFDATILAKIR